MPEQASDSPNREAARVLAHLEEVYGRAGTFGNWCELIPGRDPQFTAGDWRRAFLRIPRMRKELLLGRIWSWLSRQQPRDGSSHAFNPGKRFNFHHRSFCDLLIFEAMLDASAHFGLPSPAIMLQAEECMNLARRNARRVPAEGEEIDLFSYFPSQDHLINKASPAWRWFLSVDASVPDNDSSSIVLSSLLGLGRRLGAVRRTGPDADGNLRAFLRLLEAHRYGKGKYGQGALSYENGVGEKDHGVVTWLFDHHNELDPTSNVNVLQFLATLYGLDPFWREQACRLARPILAFLDRHATGTQFLTGRIQQYYPVGAVYYFWYRLEAALDSLPRKAREDLDPEGVAGKIGNLMAAAAPGLFGRLGLANPGDVLLAAPFLAKHRLTEKTALREGPSADVWIDHFTAHHYETFHLLYPVKMICVAKYLPLAGLLYSITESERQRVKAVAAAQI